MRVSTSKSKNSESFYINFAYIDENGKSTSKIYKKLGTLEELSKQLNTDREGVMLWAKQQAKLATEEYNTENEVVSIPFSPIQRIELDQQRSFNCGYLFLQSITSSLRFDNICRNIKARNDFDFDLKAILSDLVFSRILNPSSKKSTYDYAFSLLEQPKYQLHDVYRALSILSKESDYIQSEVYRNSNFEKKRNTSVLYYDCTNYYFEIEQEEGFKKYGKSKENRPNPIVGMGLFMDADGVPLAFDLFPGNQNEQKTLLPLEKKVIRDFDCANFIYCSDSGLGSKDNKLFNHVATRAYVITQSLKKLKKEDREIALNPAQYRKVGSNVFVNLDTLDESKDEVFNAIYYKEIPLSSKSLNETLIVTYSPKYRDYQSKIRAQQIARAQKLIDNNSKVKKTYKNNNDPARFIKKTPVTEHGEVAEEIHCELNEEAIMKEAMYDGFYAVVTDLEDQVEDVIAINKQRWQIEECFRIMKTDFGARPIYLQREDRIKAHFLICFLSLLIYRLLESKLEYKHTIEETTETLRNMNLCLVDGYGYIPTYKRTKLTDKLHDIYGYRTDTQIIKRAKMRSIIKESKKK